MSHYDTETGLVKVSWSKIRTAEECKQKAYLVSEGKKSPGQDVRNYFHGNVVDQAMRRWLSMEDPPPGWMAARVDEIVDELEAKVKEDKEGVVKWRHKDDRDQLRQFCKDCATKLEPLLRRFALPHEYQPALRFSVPMTINGLEPGTQAKILLNGEMDLLTREKPTGPLTVEVDGDPRVATYMTQTPRLRVWDLKATANKDYWRQTVAQLVFYDIVCICMAGVPTVEAGLLQPMVEGMPYISFVPSDEDRTQMFIRIESVAHSIMRGDYSPKASTAGCNWCETRHACIRYAPKPGTNEIQLF